MSNPKTLLRRMVPGLLFGFLVLLVIALLGDLRQVSQAFLGFNWRLYPFVILLTLFNYALRFLKWHFYLRQVGSEGITWLQSLRIFVAGFPLAVTPGKVGEALKGVWLKQMANLPVGTGIAVVLAERISDGLAVLALSTLGVVAYPRYWPAFVMILTVLLGIVAVSQVRPLALWLIASGERLPFLRRGMGGLRDLYEGSFALFRPGATLLAVGLGTVSWFGEGIGFFIILYGLGFPASGFTLSMAVFILSFSTVVGAVSALPGGLGAAEASIAGMLILLLGADASQATTATLLIRLGTLWFGVCLGLLVWIWSRDFLGLQVMDGQLAEN